MIIKKVVDNTKKEFYSDRLRYLVDLLLPLMQECDNIYPIIKRWKRTTKIKGELDTEWEKIFIPPKPKPEPKPEPKKDTPSDENLAIRKNYIYQADRNTHAAYAQSYNGKVIRLTEIKTSPNFQYCDSPDVLHCTYKVEWTQPYTNKIWYFWTRKQCLKPLKSY